MELYKNSLIKYLSQTNEGAHVSSFWKQAKANAWGAPRMSVRVSAQASTVMLRVAASTMLQKDVHSWCTKRLFPRNMPTVRCWALPRSASQGSRPPLPSRGLPSMPCWLSRTKAHNKLNRWCREWHHHEHPDFAKSFCVVAVEGHAPSSSLKGISCLCLWKSPLNFLKPL